MAIYENEDQVRQVKNDPDFALPAHKPGALTPNSGIYCCVTCGLEILSEEHNKFPPSHANVAIGHKVEWKLLVKTQAPQKPAMTMSRAREIVSKIEDS